ncbi:MAG: pyrroline-5-carboxylate reductase [Deltaproteobacteria bacterium]|nr:pyrroline-5-carboxylate reductase [Deltaproteobacteria bacterium]
MKKQAAIGFIGGGNMAEALIKGLIGGKMTTPGQCRVFDVLPGRLGYLQQTYGIQPGREARSVVKESRIIILAVKPQQVPQALPEVVPHWSSGKLLISIAAGITLERLAGFFPSPPALIRVMPNTPALVLAGASALCKNAAATKKDLEEAAALFGAVGETVLLDETHFDTVTGLSGSGPAYLFVILEALADAGVKLGLPRNIAAKLAAQTMLGSGLMACNPERTFGQLKEMVTSPGGTTMAGLYEMEKAGLRGIIMDAVEAATRRSKELQKLV